MRARAARPQKTPLEASLGLAELGIADHVRREPAPWMRAHDFVVQLHAGSYCLRNLVTAVDQRRRGADDDFVVALVFRGEYSMPPAAVSWQIFTISV